MSADAGIGVEFDTDKNMLVFSIGEDGQIVVDIMNRMGYPQPPYGPAAVLEEIAQVDAESRALLLRAAEKFSLSARGYHRVLRVARTIADLDTSDAVCRPHVAEALSYRLVIARET